MKFLAVHPSCLMYWKIYLRLEPLGLEVVAAAVEQAGHSVRLIDLQCEPHRDFFRAVKEWYPNMIAFCGNYLANVPEIIDLARTARDLSPDALIYVGGHSVSFIPEDFATRRRRRGSPHRGIRQRDAQDDLGSNHEEITQSGDAFENPPLVGESNEA